MVPELSVSNAHVGLTFRFKKKYSESQERTIMKNDADAGIPAEQSRKQRKKGKVLDSGARTHPGKRLTPSRVPFPFLVWESPSQAYQFQGQRHRLSFILL